VPIKTAPDRLKGSTPNVWRQTETLRARVFNACPLNLNAREFRGLRLRRLTKCLHFPAGLTKTHLPNFPFLSTRLFIENNFVKDRERKNDRKAIKASVSEEVEEEPFFFGEERRFIGGAHNSIIPLQLRIL
jgi:hypothetical protein